MLQVAVTGIVRVVACTVRSGHVCSETRLPWHCRMRHGESLDFEFVSVCCMFRKLLLLPNFVLFPSVQTQLGSCVLDPKKLGDFVISFSTLHAW